jgi:hypothetical protein
MGDVSAVTYTATRVLRDFIGSLPVYIQPIPPSQALVTTTTSQFFFFLSLMAMQGLKCNLFLALVRPAHKSGVMVKLNFGI